MKIKKGFCGFTLPEVLVSVLIGGLILSLIIIVVFYNQKFFSMLDAKIELQTNAGIALNKITNEIEAANGFEIYSPPATSLILRQDINGTAADFTDDIRLEIKRDDLDNKRLVVVKGGNKTVICRNIDDFKVSKSTGGSIEVEINLKDGNQSFVLHGSAIPRGVSLEGDSY